MMKRSANNAKLPARWRMIHGAYYYAVPPGREAQWDGKKTFRLGKTLAEAYKTWSARLEHLENGTTIADLLDRYLLDVVPTKAPKTQTDNVRQVAKLRGVFGSMRIDDLEPQHVYQYVDKREAKTAAKREVEVLSHAFSMAVAWGWMRKHPFKGEVRIPDAKARDRYVEDWEVIECLSVLGHRRKGSIKMVQAYIRLKLMTGMSRGDLLRLRTDEHLTDEGILIQRHKTANSSGKRTLYTWTPELREAVKRALEVRPVETSTWLFCRTDGNGYFKEETGEAKAWDNMWDGFMDKVLETTNVKNRFTEHDLRAKCASDATTLEHARALLSHVDARLTDRVYRRKAEVVAPLKGIKA